MRLALSNVVLCAVLAVTTGGCAHASRPASSTERPTDDTASARPPASTGATASEAATPSPRSECTAAAEIGFAQATGCQNDGSVEFCLPVGDDAAHRAVRAIEPRVTCRRGSGGRAHCDPAAFELCTLPLDDRDCTAAHGKMTDTTWERVCALAELEGVRAVVPTFYE